MTNSWALHGNEFMFAWPQRTAAPPYAPAMAYTATAAAASSTAGSLPRKRWHSERREGSSETAGQVVRERFLRLGRSPRLKRDQLRAVYGWRQRVRHVRAENDIPNAGHCQHEA